MKIQGLRQGWVYGERVKTYRDAVRDGDYEPTPINVRKALGLPEIPTYEGARRAGWVAIILLAIFIALVLFTPLGSMGV